MPQLNWHLVSAMWVFQAMQWLSPPLPPGEGSPRWDTQTAPLHSGVPGPDGLQTPLVSCGSGRIHTSATCLFARRLESGSREGTVLGRLGGRQPVNVDMRLSAGGEWGLLHACLWCSIAGNCKWDYLGRLAVSSAQTKPDHAGSVFALRSTLLPAPD